MNKTKIEWVKNPDGSQGYTWNPITGCLNHTNGLCKGGGFPCYAYKLANGRLKERYLANKDFVDYGTLSAIGRGLDVGLRSDAPFYPRFWEERLKDIQRGYHYTDWSGVCAHGASIKGIFVCDMSDLFGIGIPKEWTRKVLKAISQDTIDRFYLLTKQPQNLIKWSPFPENCWVGVTATDTYMAVKGLQSLDKIQAKVKFISFEPLLSKTCITASSLSGIGWVIIGQQTPLPAKTEPKIEWIREIVEAADRAGIWVFLKDNLRPLLIPEDCSKPNYLTEDIFWASEKAQLRQEMPEILYCSTCRVRRR